MNVIAMLCILKKNYLVFSLVASAIQLSSLMIGCQPDLYSLESKVLYGERKEGKHVCWTYSETQLPCPIS